ncbi:MAG: glycoside hydrolase family 140 protein [Bacteroidota bacterium]
MKAISLLLLAILATTVAFGQLSPLTVSNNQRYLVREDGKPFFWLGDTAWELFHRLSKEEAELYLRNRAEKGFTVIQAVALAELDGLHTPNFYGEVPLEEDDPTRPREAYFQHVDWVLNKAEELGLYVGLLPTWGDKVYLAGWGVGPEIFTPENAKVYGEWLGKRYRDRSNIIWIVGGDRNPRNEREENIWRAMAAGIEAGVGSRNKALLTFHPQPNGLNDGGSAKWFHQDEWLDFNMFQTGHCRENPVWDRIQYTYQLEPTKPVIDGETIYEDHPVCFNAKDLGTSSAYDVRKHAYLAVFAGAFGHTYGCHDIWQMYAPNRKGINGPHFPWYVAMELEGASQMRYLRALMESRPMLERIPDQALLTSGRYEHDRIQATRGESYLMVYSSQGRGFEVRTDVLTGQDLIAHWYNPRTGEIQEAGSFPKQEKQTFTPPKSGYGQDWVLIVDDASKGYGMPKVGE